MHNFLSRQHFSITGLAFQAGLSVKVSVQILRVTQQNIVLDFPEATEKHLFL